MFPPFPQLQLATHSRSRERERDPASKSNKNPITSIFMRIESVDENIDFKLISLKANKNSQINFHYSGSAFRGLILATSERWHSAILVHEFDVRIRIHQTLVTFLGIQLSWNYFNRVTKTKGFAGFTDGASELDAPIDLAPFQIGFGRTALKV